MSDSMAKEEALLRRIMDAARYIQDKMRTRLKGHIPYEQPCADLQIPTHFLSSSEIQTDLLSLGLSPESVQLISPSVSSLNTVYQRAVERFSRRLDVPGLPATHEIVHKLALYFRETYRKEVLPVLRERILAVLHAQDAERFVEVDETEPLFNAVSGFYSFSYFQTPPRSNTRPSFYSISSSMPILPLQTVSCLLKNLA